jgi:hypothetical protein
LKNKQVPQSFVLLYCKIQAICNFWQKCVWLHIGLFIFHQVTLPPSQKRVPMETAPFELLFVLLHICTFVHSFSFCAYVLFVFLFVCLSFWFSVLYIFTVSTVCGWVKIRFLNKISD